MTAGRAKLGAAAVRSLVVVIALLVAGAAAAQVAWTVQIVALRDLRDANAEVDQLRAQGLPAYTEFAMRDGLQYVRVRVGCYDARETADAWASLLRERITAEAVPVPIEASLPAGVPCVATEVGFRKPATWSLISASGEMPLFRLELAGHEAFLRHDGDGWRLWQSVAPDPLPAAATSAAAAAVVRVGSVAGHPVARHVAAGVLCPGRLIATAGSVAIVDQGEAIVACSLATPP